MGADTLKTAVIGVGHLGRHHARLMGQAEGSELVGIVDANIEQARAIAAPLDVPAYASVDELPDSVQAATVAAPTVYHHDITCALLKRGVHVLVEKPMAATEADAEAMAELADANNLVLQVGHIERFNPALRVLRELRLRPRFIEAHRLAPFNFRTLDVSVVMDLMIHDLDLVLELVDSKLDRVDASGSNFLAQHTDLANARLTFADGCVANVTASRVSFEPMRKTRVFTERAFVSLDFGTRRAFVATLADGFDPGSLTAAHAKQIDPDDSFKEWVQKGLMTLREIDMDETNPLADEIHAFLMAARGKENELDLRGCSADEGLRAVQVAHQVARAIAGR